MIAKLCKVCCFFQKTYNKAEGETEPRCLYKTQPTNGKCKKYEHDVMEQYKDYVEPKPTKLAKKLLKLSDFKKNKGNKDANKKVGRQSRSNRGKSKK